MAELRADALRIARAGVAAAEPAQAVRRSLRVEEQTLWVGSEGVVEVAKETRVVLLAVGKAAAVMAGAAVERLGERVTAGAVTVPLLGEGPPAAGTTRSTPVRRHATGTPPTSIASWEAGHPFPDIGGMAAAADALALARAAGEDDLVVCLLSGGASALWAAPALGLTLDDLRATSHALLRSGAPIEAVNSVRKHLSAVAGGRLAAAAVPARVVTLAVSDVIGAAPDAIGSGPTLPDPSSFADALEVARRYAVALPAAVLHHLRLGAAGAVAETPKPGELSNVVGFEVILCVEHAVTGAAEEARRLGYETRVVSTALRGEARSAGAAVAAAAVAARAEEAGPGVALLWGGETTVTVRGEGHGGRNQELALAAAVALRGEGGLVVASLGTDGRDGPTDAAGAMVDGGTVGRGVAAGLDAAASLHANDSYSYLRATGDLIITGPTGTNVNDITVALVSPAPGAESA